MRCVGLDVHKRSVVACVLDEDGRHEVACTREALGRFARETLRPDVVALESTTRRRTSAPKQQARPATFF